jgi:hypothetical protein
VRVLRTLGSALLMFVGGIVGGALGHGGAIHAQGSPQGRKQPWAVRPDGTVVFRSVVIGNENGARFELRDGSLLGFSPNNNRTVALSTVTKAKVAVIELKSDDEASLAHDLILGPNGVSFGDPTHVGGPELTHEGLTVRDDSFTERVVIGPVSTVRKQSGVTTRSSIGTITIFDEKGDVVWQMPPS